MLDPKTLAGIEKRVDKALHEVLQRQLGEGVPDAPLRPADRLVEDYHADDLDLRELQMDLEDKLDVVIPDEDWTPLSTVGEVREWLRRTLVADEEKLLKSAMKRTS